jgi:hypothetical protein
LAQEELAAARQLYERLAAVQGNPMVQQRAAYGLAKCLEAQGDFEQAIQEYEQIVSTWSGSPFAALATERISALKRPETKQWYSWFAQQEPIRSPLNDPGLFQDLPNLPDTPDLGIPTPGGSLGPSGSTDGTTGTAAPSSLIPGDSSSDGIELPLLPELGGSQPATGDASADPTGGTSGDRTDEPVKLDIDLPPVGDTPSPEPQPSSSPELELEPEPEPAPSSEPLP